MTRHSRILAACASPAPQAPDEAGPSDRAAFLIRPLQSLLPPDPALPGPSALYWTVQGRLRQGQGGAILLDDGACVGFDGFFNILNMGQWHRLCGPVAPGLAFQGRGRLRVVIEDLGAPAGTGVLVSATVDLSPGRAVRLAVTPPPGALLAVRVRAIGPARLDLGRWEAGVTRLRPLDLALVITTFQRQSAVTRTAARIAAHLDARAAEDKAAGAGRTHLFIIDNGRDLRLPPHPGVTVIPNRNLGGAGGFARGLAAARAGGFSHCLFMDDDAQTPLDALTRSRSALELARDSRTAIAGGMIATEKPGTLWENAARFDRVCRPHDSGTDLTQPAAVLRLERARATRAPGAQDYGGWWFFAFPVAHVRHDPFPFFVRGDDSSFSLANRFTIATLGGVVAFQDSFAGKDTPLTAYLDLRYHLHHHLVHPGLALGRVALACVALRLVARSLLSLHYASAEAQLMAWADVLGGPAVFLRNLDFRAKRRALAPLVRAEAWHDGPPPAPIPPARHEPLRRWQARLWKITLNGHLLPGFGRWGGHLSVQLAARGARSAIWGAAQIVHLGPAGSSHYHLRHDKARFATLALRAAWLTLRGIATHDRLCQAYRGSYGRMTAPAFWQRRFRAGSATPKGPA